MKYIGNRQLQEKKKTPQPSNPSTSRINKKKKPVIAVVPQIARPVRNVTSQSRPALDCCPPFLTNGRDHSRNYPKPESIPQLSLSPSHPVRSPTIHKFLVIDAPTTARYRERWWCVRITVWVRIWISDGKRSRKNTRISVAFCWPTL